MPTGQSAAGHAPKDFGGVSGVHGEGNLWIFRGKSLQHAGKDGVGRDGAAPHLEFAHNPVAQDFDGRLGPVQVAEDADHVFVQDITGLVWA